VSRPTVRRHSYQDEKLLGGVAWAEEIRERLAENRPSISVIPGSYESARTNMPVSLT
jgi:hypothetical protein